MSDFNHKGHISPKEALLALRERAERWRNLITRAVDDGTPDDAVQRLVQELQTHQIELEMQYEELLIAQSEAETARAEYVDLYDFAPIGYLTLDARGTIQQLNLSAAQLLGDVRQKLIRRRLALFIPEQERAVFYTFLDAMLASEDRQTCELRFIRDNGQELYVQLEGNRVTAAENAVQFRLALLDVSARRAATEALAMSEARFRQLFEQSADAVVLIRNLRIVDCNAAALRLIGATEKSELVNKPLNFLVPEFQPGGGRSDDLIQQHYNQLLRGGAHRFEWYRSTMRGEYKWLEVVATYINVNGEQLVHAVWRDITQQRAAQEQLRAEKEFSENLLDNSVDGIIALDRWGRVTAWNREAEKYSGLLEAEVVGQEIFALFPSLDTPEWQQRFGQVLHSGEQTVLNGLPFIVRPGHYDAYLVPLRGEQQDDISGVLVVVRDMTERNRLIEETTQLKLSQQQEVLSAILTTEEAERKRIAEALHNGVGQLLYAAKLHLETHAGPGRPRRDEAHVLLNEAIRMTRTISFELTPGILEDFGLKFALEELARRIPRGSLSVHLHLSGLEQPLPRLMEVAVYRIVQELFNNIIKHARAQEAFIHVVRENDKLAISVEDNGQGFEPTPNFVPRHGIGLPGLQNRVGLLGGSFTINSRPGQGTIVSIELPVK
ncbi:PAS domain-containing sensor histidine kinase [Hymenobacter sp. YC55]|uniref:PAS domain-containing sensor histidine kinase n=1 Tax=Hymenobacter sp. YC55 TaxID=3034019 RepID=UPI0023F6641F|nr:PAS domain-containing sensor histidine kinase [Hymenobacter sp. YC55]MDF7811942.1 PAS domain S-box protein [Hymenobacter sp. YC55]